MRILVTGGSGFIGTNLVEHFSSRGDEVLNIDIAKPRNRAHISFWKFGDLLDVEGLRTNVQDFSPELIFHMAARTDLDGLSVDDYSVNTIGVENLIAAVENLNSLRRLIFASSRLVCRIGYTPSDEFDYCPTTAYGESKVIGEKLVRKAFSQLPCPALIVRPTSIWGPWFDVPYKTFFLTIANNRYVHPAVHKIQKSFGFVLNTVYQLDTLMNGSIEEVDNKTFYLADYPPIEVSQFANEIQKSIGSKKIRAINISVLKILGICGDLLKFIGYKNPPLTSFRLDNLLTPMVYDLDNLEDIVGELPYSMIDGVRITTDWLRATGQIN